MEVVAEAVEAGFPHRHRLPHSQIRMLYIRNSHTIRRMTHHNCILRFLQVEPDTRNHMQEHLPVAKKWQ